MTETMPIQKASELSSKQSLAWRYLEENRQVTELLYGGAAGGGKTWLGCLWQTFRRIQYPGTRGLIGRAKLSNLKLTTLKTFFELWENYGQYNPAGVTCNYNAQDKIIRFSNGSEIIVKDLFFYPSDPEFTALGGLEITDAFIDEATEVTEKAFEIVRSRIRYRIDELAVPLPKILLSGNPSANWVKYRYVLTRDNKPIELQPFQQFIPANLDDNPNKTFAELYRSNLKQLSKYDQQRLLLGNWAASPDKGGEFYHAFDLVRHCSADVKYNPELPIHVSFDQNVVPYITATVWQISTEGQNVTLYAIREFCLENPRNNTADLCKVILQVFADHHAGLFYYGDASGHRRDTRGPETDYSIARRILRPLISQRSDRTERRNPPVLRRRDFINEILAGRTRVRMKVNDEQCPNLVADLLELKQDMNGSKLKEKERDPRTGVAYERLGHCSDTMDYFITRVLEKDFERFIGR